MKFDARFFHRFVRSSLAVAAFSAIASGQTATVPWRQASNRALPKEFGIQDQTITVIPATEFNGADAYNTTPDLAVGCSGCTYGAEYWAPLEIPAGAIIDYLGVNNATDTDAIMGAALWKRDRHGAKTMLYGFSFPPHGWDTDVAGPLNIFVPDHLDKELVLQVEQAANGTGGSKYFAWVEIHWHREVSAHEGSPTFGDVPSSDFGYQFIEALAASGITGGCGGGNFCPDSNLTRRQMAIFLAKALGLHWPN
jgi:hypothetical protein